jgi:hypothetical protein
MKSRRPKSGTKRRRFWAAYGASGGEAEWVLYCKTPKTEVQEQFSRAHQLPERSCRDGACSCGWRNKVEAA